MGVFSQYSRPRKYNYRVVGDLNMNCISEHECILRDYLKEETKCWIDDDTFTVTDMAEKILESICKRMYEIYAIDPEFEYRENVNIFPPLMKAEFLKRQVRQGNEDIDFNDFAKKFEKFRNLMTQTSISGDLPKRLQDILNKEDIKGEVENSYVALNAKSREFYIHYIKKEQKIRIKEVKISEDSLLLYLIMFSIWLCGQDSGDTQLENFRQTLLNYRSKTGAKLELHTVVHWCMRCCSELVFYNRNLFTDEKVSNNEKIFVVTIYGINEFLDKFGFSEVAVKFYLRGILLGYFVTDEKTIPFDEFTNFMMQFRLDSLSTDKPFMGKWGALQKANGNKRYASTNYQYIKKYLQEYFKPQFDKEFVYKYFDFSVDPQILNYFSKEDEMMMWEDKECNHLVSNIFVLLNPPNDNYLSVFELWNLLEHFFSQMEEINNKMTGWEKKYLAVRRMLKDEMDSVNDALDKTEKLCQTILDEFNLIWTSGRLEVSAPFLDKLAKMPGDEIRTKDGKEIYWEGGDDLCKIMTEMYLRIFI